MIGSSTLLAGARVTLRPYAAGFTADEIERFRAWAVDPEVVSLAGGAPVDMAPERFRALFLARLPERNSEREQQFAILDERGALIGRTGLFALDRQARVAELGIMIGQRDCWNQGYGRDAVHTLARFAFQTLGIRRIVLFTYPDNVRAQRAFSSVGFRAVRKLRRFTLDRGLHAEIEMELTPTRLRLPTEALAGDG